MKRLIIILFFFLSFSVVNAANDFCYLMGDISVSVPHYYVQNTTDEIFTVCNNGTFHKFSETITWGNLSSWNLNVVWTNKLEWGNISNALIQNSSYNYWTNNTLTDTYNVTYNGYVVSNVSNVSQQCYYMNNATDRTAFLLTWNATYDAKPSTDTVNTTAQMVTAINVSSNNYILTKIYVNVTCKNPSCSRNITDNSTNIIIYG